MKIEKLKSESVGTHYPYQAMILTDTGEIYATKDTLSDQGYELVKFQTYDVSQITSIVNQLLNGNPIASVVEVTPEMNTIFVSTVGSLFKLKGYSDGEELTTIIGGRQGQIITLITDGTPVLIKSSGNLKLQSEMTITNEYSSIVIQKTANQWIELSRSQNT